ncbi:hypothetical protein FOCC_FOCC002052 [Frankliniella occidentalis]|nr:hypothetical protein FOCC_FOCC002052 [Frankliniella occidentalis]
MYTIINTFDVALQQSNHDLEKNKKQDNYKECENLTCLGAQMRSLLLTGPQMECEWHLVERIKCSNCGKIDKIL